MNIREFDGVELHVLEDDDQQPDDLDEMVERFIRDLEAA
jgi:hypothetical protein